MRDVSKAFDKVWHNGLKYKIHKLNLPPIITKTLCNYIDNRTVAISLPTHEGPPFPIHSGVPQGSCISPTLYIIYTADSPKPLHGNYDITYADDITQIITQPGKSRKMLARKIENEIKNINRFEHQWKIKTNTNKFTILPLAIIMTEPVTINNNIIPYSSTAKILGLTLTKNGYRKY